MRYPSAPNIEMGFYLGPRSETPALQRLVRAIVQEGNWKVERAALLVAPGAGHLKFEGVADLDGVSEVPVHDDRVLDERFDRDDVLVLQVGLASSDGRSVELATHCRMSRRALASDVHPVAVLVGGSGFEGYEATRLRVRQGRDAYRQFCLLVRSLVPIYATITVELQLLCPTDLQVQAPEGLFRSFFLADALLESGPNRVRRLAEGAYVEDVGPGIYISTDSIFSPLPSTAPHRSASRLEQEVAQLIVAKGTGWPS